MPREFDRNKFQIRGFSCVYECADGGYLISNRVHLKADDALEFGLSTERNKHLIGLVNVQFTVVVRQLNALRREYGNHEEPERPIDVDTTPRP